MTNRFIKLWTLCSLFGICCGIKAGISDKNKEMPVYGNIEEPIIVQNIVKNVEQIENSYQICDTDKEIITKLVYLEARGECYDGKKAVVSIVFNRLKSGYWGNTISDIVYAKGQFAPAKLIKNTYIDKENKVWKECINAVEDVITYGSTLPEYVLYFRADYYFSWAKDYKNIGNHYFSYLQKDYNKFIDSSNIY